MSSSARLKFSGAKVMMRAFRNPLFPDNIPISEDFRSRRSEGTRPRSSLCHGHLSRSEEHTSELQSLMRIPYAVFCLNKQISTISLEHHTKHNITATQHIIICNQHDTHSYTT